MNKATLKNDPAMIGKLLGAEIEYYPTSGSNDVSATHRGGLDDTLDVTTDGSLGHGGREIRLLTVVALDGRIHDLLNLKIEGTVNKNCGLHVHVDARHLGKNGLLSVEETYDRLTDNTRGGRTIKYCFKKLVPKSRHNNRYCKWKSNRAYGATRYAAFNFQSFRKHGTIEFRMAAGSTNKHKIEMWALLCQHVLNYAAVPTNVMPVTWAQFLAILSGDLRTWVEFRRQQLEGSININARLMAALLGEGEVA